MSAEKVQALMDDIRLLGGGQYELVESVRLLARKVIKPLSEDVKYGGIVFSSGVHFGGVFAYRSHVSVEFGCGAKIADEFGHLEGSGKFRRHVKLHSIEDIERKHLARYLSLGLEAAKSVAPQD